MMLRATLRGFTLIEVMVALTIVALSLTALTASMSQMIDAAHTMRERTYASWIAQNRITEIRLQQSVPEPGNSNGEVEYANTDWAWRTIISETGVEDLYRIDVSVSLAGSEDVIRSVSGFVGNPSAVGEANRAWMRVPQTGTQTGSGATG